MRLTTTFDLACAVLPAWELLTDLPRIARCLPGARVDTEADGGCRGGLRLTAGSVAAEYRGSARFLERDEVGYRAVLQARGRAEDADGSATATVSLALHPVGAGTRVEVDLDLVVTGRIADAGPEPLAAAVSSTGTDFLRRLAEESTRPAPVRSVDPVAATDEPGDSAEKPGDSTGRSRDSVDRSDRVAPCDAVGAVESARHSGFHGGGSSARAMVPLAAVPAGFLAGWLVGRRSARS
jgi:carbon monoxide dehydrogenase subunit G